MRRPIFSAALISLGLLLLLAAIACWSLGGDALLHGALLLRRGAAGVGFVKRLTNFGGAWVMIPAGLVATAWVAWQLGRRPALWLFLTIASGRLIVEGVKPMFHRARPPVADRLAHVTSWSLPSSHSAGTMLTGLALAVLLGGRWGIVAALAFSALIGWTRLALGVHWPSDVLAGWGFGLLWVVMAARWMPVPAGKDRSQ